MIMTTMTPEVAVLFGTAFGAWGHAIHAKQGLLSEHPDLAAVEESDLYEAFCKEVELGETECPLYEAMRESMFTEYHARRRA
jgi:hypothetical protein